jgi:hypothetical protein
MISTPPRLRGPVPTHPPPTVNLAQTPKRSDSPSNMGPPQLIRLPVPGGNPAVSQATPPSLKKTSQVSGVSRIQPPQKVTGQPPHLKPGDVNPKQNMVMSVVKSESAVRQSSATPPSLASRPTATPPLIVSRPHATPTAPTPRVTATPPNLQRQSGSPAPLKKPSPVQASVAVKQGTGVPPLLMKLAKSQPNVPLQPPLLGQTAPKYSAATPPLLKPHSQHQLSKKTPPSRPPSLKDGPPTLMPEQKMRPPTSKRS